MAETTARPGVLLAQGWRAFFALGSVLSAANLVSRHGFHWNGYLHEIVLWYRQIFDPFTAYVLRPVFGPVFVWLHMVMTPLWTDAITLFLIGLGASNAESVARHGKPVAMQLIDWTFRGGLIDGQPKTFLGVGEEIDDFTWVAAPSGIIGVVATIGAIAYALHLFAHTGLLTSVVVSIVGYIILLVLDVVLEDVFRKAGWTWLWRISGVTLAIPVYVGFSIAAVILLIISPLLAWRTAIVCCGLFVAFAVLNQFVR